MCHFQDRKDLRLSEGRELNGLGGEVRASAAPVLQHHAPWSLNGSNSVSLVEIAAVLKTEGWNGRGKVAAVPSVRDYSE